MKKIQNDYFGELTVQEWQDLINEHKANLNDEVPAVYCGTYAKYNFGSLFGEWIDLSSFADYEEFIAFCKVLHHDEEDPELMFQDYENFHRQWYSESCMDEETFDKIAAYADLDDDDREIFDAYVECYNDYDSSMDEIKERYHGKFNSKEDFAIWYVDEVHFDDITDFMRDYFDYEAYANDLFANDFSMENHHVFSDR